MYRGCPITTATAICEKKKQIKKTTNDSVQILSINQVNTNALSQTQKERAQEESLSPKREALLQNQIGLCASQRREKASQTTLNYISMKVDCWITPPYSAKSTRVADCSSYSLLTTSYLHECCGTCTAQVQRTGLHLVYSLREHS